MEDLLLNYGRGHFVTCAPERLPEEPGNELSPNDLCKIDEVRLGAADILADSRQKQFKMRIIEFHRMQTSSSPCELKELSSAYQIYLSISSMTKAKEMLS